MYISVCIYMCVYIKYLYVYNANDMLLTYVNHLRLAITEQCDRAT